MSWDPTFRVVLADPTDRAAALAIARRLARACRLQRCGIETTGVEAARALVRAHPSALALNLDGWGALALPPLLLGGVATSITLELYETTSILVRFARDRRGEPVTTFAIDADAGPARDTVVEACVALARRLRVLTGAPSVSTTDRREAVVVPVYADAFPVLASELTFGVEGYYVLAVEVEAAHASELLATTKPPFAIVLHLEHDESPVLAALPDLVVDARVTVHWDEPHPDAPWIPDIRDSYFKDDGRIYGVSLAVDPAGCAITIKTIIDHCGTETAAAWLAARAGAPVAYVDPRVPPIG